MSTLWDWRGIEVDVLGHSFPAFAGTFSEQSHRAASADAIRSHGGGQLGYDTFQALGIGDLTRSPVGKIFHVNKAVPYHQFPVVEIELLLDLFLCQDPWDVVVK